MSKAKVIVLSVVEQGLTKTEAARQFDVSWRWVHTLVARYETDGLDGLEPRSRRPRSSPRSTPEPVRARILQLREKLTIDGLDAGPATIAWHPSAEGIDPPLPSRPSGGSSPPPAWSTPNHANAPARPCAGT
jgi:hypothetical protein